MALLIIERGNDTGQRIHLNRFPVVIGRDVKADVVVNDPDVSRQHLQIKKRGRLVICQDLESRNGTHINGDKIKNAVLRNGDKILIGSTELHYVASQPDIRIADDYINLDHDMPIIETGADIDQHYTPKRLSLTGLHNHHTTDTATVKLIFNLHANIMSTDSLEEATHSLLASTTKLLPLVKQARVYYWVAARRQLIPHAGKHFTAKKNPFIQSQRYLEDVLLRKSGVLLSAKNAKDRSALLMPMLCRGDVIAIVQIEFREKPNDDTSAAIERLQSLLWRVAATFESLLLRRELDSWMVGMIDTMVAAIEAKDTYTHGHSERVSRYSLAIADQLHLDRETKRLLLISSLCHDIGKIGVPDAILKKASLLSSEEYEEMKLHPTIGADIVRHLPHAERFISGVKHHHEKWDGTGYPDGLIGEEIPFFGRIVAIADVFDAMISGRSYSGFIDQSDAIARIVEEQELFDPEIVKACTKAHADGTLTIKTSTANNDLPDADDK